MIHNELKTEIWPSGCFWYAKDDQRFWFWHWDPQNFKIAHPKVRGFWKISRDPCWINGSNFTWWPCLSWLRYLTVRISTKWPENWNKRKKKTTHPSAYITVATRCMHALDKTFVLESLLFVAFYHRQKCLLDRLK